MIIDRQLVQRLEHADAQHTADYATVRERLWPGSGARVQQIADGYAVFTGAMFPICRAVGLGMRGPITAADVDQVEQFFAAHDLPVEVDLCPHADPSLHELLQARGYGVMRFLNVHVRPLTAADRDVPHVQNIAVTPLDASDEDAWIRAMIDDTAGTRPADDVGVMLAHMGFNKPHAKYFVASVSGELAGGGAMVMRDGAAILFSASTHPQFRKRGVQTALLAHRLDVAAHAGCDLAMVLTTPGSASDRNVQRSGFRVAYTKATMVKE